MQITTIGLDIAKNVFQVARHRCDREGRRQETAASRSGHEVLRSSVALPHRLEACATAHYWARELRKLGHQVRLMPARSCPISTCRG
jgi:transposase